MSCHWQYLPATGCCYGVCNPYDESVTWFEAESSCRDVNGHLTSINSITENTFVGMHLEDVLNSDTLPIAYIGR